MSRSADRSLLASVPDRLLPGVVQTVDEQTLTCTVLLPAVDDGRATHGPAPYTPKVTGSSCPGLVNHHPRRGTRCLVVEDIEDGMWVAEWVLS